MKTTYNYRELGCGIVHQAVKDYFDPKSIDSPKSILKYLRSDYLVQLSDGISLVVAEQLEKHPKEIAERLKKEEGI